MIIGFRDNSAVAFEAGKVYITSMLNVEIFCAPMCGACEEAKDYFQGRGISFTSTEVRWDAENDRWVDSENSRRMLKMCGEIDFVPQIFVNDRHIKGWRGLTELIKSGEIDSILEDGA
jgi:glutaredoxin